MTEVTIVILDDGLPVICDLCSEDYTTSESPGGYVFCDKGVCPKCAEEFMQKIKRYKEQEYIQAVALPGESFSNFIKRFRAWIT